MAIVSFNIPDALIPELNLIAQAENFPTAKALFIYWLQGKVRVYRGNKAAKESRELAEAQADLDTGGIT